MGCPGFAPGYLRAPSIVRVGVLSLGRFDAVRRALNVSGGVTRNFDRG